jgi:hypothetical protein
VKRTIQASVLSVVFLATSAGVANAAASDQASCLGQLASTLAPGVGAGSFVSGEAKAGAGGEFGATVVTLAQGTNVEECPG